jgi:hypothetical protein
MLKPERSVQGWGVMGFEGTEAHVLKRLAQEPAESFSGEVLVTESNGHVRIENRVVAIRLDDQSGSARSQHPVVLLEGPLRGFHVMERVLRMHDVEGVALEGKMFGVSDLEREPVFVAPGVRWLHVDRVNRGDPLAE